MHGAVPYVELHCHSAYSFLDGASLPEELVGQAAELGHVALALTDHDSLSGSMELAMAAKDTSLRAIHGAEVTLILPGTSPNEADERLHHITLLVRDRAGWQNLCRLLTHAHAHTRDGPGRRARPSATSLEALREHAQGLVCLSGCATHGVHQEEGLRMLLEVFGPEGLRVELQRPYARHDRARNRMLERLARKVGVKTVATGDVHAHAPGRALLQDAFVSLKHGMTLDASECKRRPNHSHVLTRPEAMAARLADHPEALAETVRLAETLTFDLCSDLGYRYPGSENPEARSTLTEVCKALFSERYPPGNPHRAEATLRLEQELAVIDSLGLAGFFLLHHEIFELAQEAAFEVRGHAAARALLPPGRGRGSSVSSIVCYLTGLSHIDPIEGQLAIGRFLHEEIKSLPDIDLDFPRDVRERLIPKIHTRYGREHSALVAAFPTFRARGAIRELGKVLGLPPGEIERVARSAEAWGGREGLADSVEAVLGERRVRSGRWAWLIRLAQEAYGLPRHLSQHSGGMIVSTRPLIDCCPVLPAAMGGRQIVQWDKDSCADASFLKIDLLGLGMLSAVERCVELIAQRSGEYVDLSRIPFDDQQTFACIQSAETTGAFQIESRAQMASLRRTKPLTLSDLTIQVALVRPGPIIGGAVNPYIERRQRLLADPGYQIPYAHPSLEEPLRLTLGTIVFQDQVIEVARAFAGFTAGQAESLRRAMSRKRSGDAIGRLRGQFVDGAMSTYSEVDQAKANQVWEMVAGFAGFGFPKAHGAAFGLLAYQSTWLRVHHPSEFLCALLDEQPMGFYAPDSLIHEAQRRAIEILQPDVNHSDLECTVTPRGAVQLGLGYVKGLDAEAASALVASREAMGPFRSLEDLAARSAVGQVSLERLAWSGACDALAGGGPHARRFALWQLGIAKPADLLKSGAGAQLALEIDLDDPPRLPAPSEWEAMLADYASTGVSIARHPLALLRQRLASAGVCDTKKLQCKAHGAWAQVAGLVIARQRPSTAKGVTFLLLEDEHGSANVIVPPPLYERRRVRIRSEPLVLVTGHLERHLAGAGAINLIAQEIELLDVAHQLAAAERPVADVKRLPTATQDFQAVAPPVLSFAQGRRR
jgi:error-prone DNA polymerase